jgi:hypothetical protein
LIGGALLLPFAARAAPAPPEVRALSWEGRAHAKVGGRELDLVSRTRIELPLLLVGSTSWIVAEGPEKARTLVLEPADAWVEMAGARRPLPAQLAIHERQQYAIYALLLQAQSQPRRPGSALAINEPPYPDVRFRIGADGFPESAELQVDSPEPGKPPIAERVVFAGRIRDKHVQWPRRFELFQDDKPYFTLDIETFSVELA